MNHGEMDDDDVDKVLCSCLFGQCFISFLYQCELPGFPQISERYQRIQMGGWVRFLLSKVHTDMKPTIAVDLILSCIHKILLTIPTFTFPLFLLLQILLER